MKHVAFLQGKSFYLRELRDSDLLGAWHSWLNDEDVTKHQNKKIFPATVEKQRKYFEMVGASQTDVVLAIVDRESDRHIGNVGLHKIDWVHRSAEVGILIGEREFWGRRIGSDAWGLISRYAFETLNLERLFAYILVENVASIRCAERSGFKQVGIIEKYLFKRGEYRDACYVNCTREQFAYDPTRGAVTPGPRR